jgi:hypothetical protein
MLKVGKPLFDWCVTFPQVPRILVMAIVSRDEAVKRVEEFKRLSDFHAPEMKRLSDAYHQFFNARYTELETLMQYGETT